MSRIHRSVSASRCAGALVLAACAACSNNQQEPLVPASRWEPPPAERPVTEHEAGRADGDQGGTKSEGTLGLSSGIRERCKLPETRAASPQFDFDESELRPRGQGILDGVAACMQEGGALSGESITVVGHADPRGTSEYNRGLGMHRAEATRRYLASKGIPEARVNVRSRGESEATGTDPASWQLDRHVQIEEATPAQP